MALLSAPPPEGLDDRPGVGLKLPRVWPDRSNRSISLRHCAAVRRARCLVPLARLMIPLASVWGERRVNQTLLPIRTTASFAVKVLGLGTNKSPQPEDASQWLMARGGVSAARWLFGLPRFVARWRPRPERVVFQTVAAVACRHRRTATQWRAIFSSSGVDGHAPTMSVCPLTARAAPGRRASLPVGRGRPRRRIRRAAQAGSPACHVLGRGPARHRPAAPRSRRPAIRRAVRWAPRPSCNRAPRDTGARSAPCYQDAKSNRGERAPRCTTASEWRSRAPRPRAAAGSGDVEL